MTRPLPHQTNAGAGSLERTAPLKPSARLTVKETTRVERTPQTAIKLTEMRGGKLLIRYFVSYAHDDKDLKEKLLTPLKRLLAISKEYCFEACGMTGKFYPAEVFGPLPTFGDP